MSSPPRALTLLDCFGIGVNGIVGSGIFLLPATLARRAGAASPLGWLCVGGLCTLVALSFAEAASRTDRSGGPYRYATDAFGPHVGFVVGWITLASSILGYAAVARGFAEHAALLVAGRAAHGPTVVGVVAALVAVLAALNVYGVKPSARAGDAISVVKLVALVGFVMVALLLVGGRPSVAQPVPGPGEPSGILAAAFAGLFACTGFEYVPVPAGETRDPQRAVGLAMVLSVVGATVLYALLQFVFVRAAADPAHSAAALVDAAEGLGGPRAGVAMAALALVSAFGFCSGSALVGPRYVEGFAQDGFLPAAFARRGARNTPVVAIVGSSLLVVSLAATLDFTALADTSTVAVVSQYASTAAAVIVLRRRERRGGAKAAFRLPLGPLVPALALLGSAAFFAGVAPREWALAGALLVGGLSVGLATRALRQR